MGRPDYEDSTAGGTSDLAGDEVTSVDYVYFGGQTTGALTHSDNTSQGMLYGALQESDDGTP